MIEYVSTLPADDSRDAAVYTIAGDLHRLLGDDVDDVTFAELVDAVLAEI